MARVDTLGHFLTDVADAIRAKKGSSDTIQASDFDTEIENLPSGGGINISSLNDYINAKEELFQKFDDFLNSKMDLYPAYTADAITIYAPNNFKHYIVHKKSNGKYRIIWSNYNYACVFDNTLVGFFGLTMPYSNIFNNRPTPIMDAKNIKTSLIPVNRNESYYNSYYNWDSQYYSNDFNTIEELYNAITNENGNITYYQYSNGIAYTASLDTPYLITYSNIPVVDRRNNNFELIQSQIFSKNETIITS